MTYSTANAEVSYTISGIKYDFKPVSRKDLVRHELHAAALRPSKSHWWPRFVRNEFSDECVENGWITGDGIATSLGQCVREFHMNFNPPEPDVRELFHMPLLILIHIEFNVMSAGWDWTSDLAGMLAEFY